MGRISRERKLRRQRELNDRALLDRVRQALPGKHMLAPPEARTLPPLSKRITDLVAPELKRFPSRLDTEKMIAMAVLAWNASLLPAGFGKTQPPTPELMNDPVFRGILAGLAARKREMFPDDDRMVLDYQLTDEGGSPRLSVVSTKTSESPPANREAKL